MKIAAFTACLLWASGSAAQDAKKIVEQALRNLGDVKSIQYSGSGAVFTLGQNASPQAAWPRVEVKSFTQTYDYANGAGRTDSMGAQNPAPTQFVSGAHAWSLAANGNVTPAASAVAQARQLYLWMTPHGFLKGALSSTATAKAARIAGRPVTQVSFTKEKHRLTGTISGGNLIEKVEARLDNPVLGDMLVEAEFSDYRDFGGAKFPARMVQKQGGFPTADFTITAVTANVPLDAQIPGSVRDAAPPAVKVASEKIGEGVWYLTGGSHHSVLIEFKDHLAVIEAPQTEDRSNAVIAEVKKLVPGKPIRYLISTHHHFDHSGGLRTYIAEGATIVAHQINKPFYEQVGKLPHALNPDRLAKEKKRAKVVGIAARHTLTDGAQTVDLHHIQGNPHHEGILMAYLPKDKILIEVDVYSPQPPNAAPPAAPPRAAVNLFENIERLKLDVSRIAPLHGRLVTMADLRKTIGK